MFTQATLTDLSSAISSPASADGASPCDSLDGPMRRPSGPDRARASLSARRAQEMGLLTSGTYGRRGSISSSSADLAVSLANRLQVVTDLRGSTLFNLTWKVVATPSGRLISALRASARTSCATDSYGWPRMPTPTACDGKGSGRKRLDRVKGFNLRDWFNVHYDFRYPPAQIVCEMMTYPIAWLSCAASAMQSSRKSSRNSSVRT